ncbi:hypothetical protein BTO06_05010 [Tenacibaculum sp. SZ-18]|uniref:outer membrane beta-barrel protein n=1 Tax=Tenacibaculum sp. SZ-18 TaxID=754423 RepID=UPI000C2D3435|nr:outer membrane beta-barrel protein [Tenacibaculum sp. SZ-18]AUC14543.1 hypothetical protein BTO06_05010 [Tenacibaculum sp. SZ-18]
MKNLFSILLLFVLLISFNSFSQSSEYGVTAGYNNFIASVNFDNQIGESSDGASGYYIGLFGDFKISDKFSFIPEVQFNQVFNNGENGEILILPLKFEYTIVDKFNVNAGPVLDYYLSEKDENITDFGLGLGLGGSYDLTDKLSITTMYSIGLINRTPDLKVDFGFTEIFDVNTKFDFFQVGLAYKLK